MDYEIGAAQLRAIALALLSGYQTLKGGGAASFRSPPAPPSRGGGETVAGAERRWRSGMDVLGSYLKDTWYTVLGSFLFSFARETLYDLLLVIYAHIEFLL